MNGINRLVWNEAARKWVAAPEPPKGRAQKSRLVVAMAVALGGASSADGLLAGTTARAGEPIKTACQAGERLFEGQCWSRGLMMPSAPTASRETIGLLEQGGASVGTPVVSHDGKYSSGNARALGFDSLAAGAGSLAEEQGSTAVGNSARATQFNTTALGILSSATAQGAVALGWESASASTNGTALGSQAKVGANANAAVAVGFQASAMAANAVALGSDAVADRANTVAVGSSAAMRQIVNMAAGTQANDAVNVGQLTPMVRALGGGASFDGATGAVTGPTYTLAHGGAQTTVGGALTALDGGLTDTNNDVTALDGRVTRNENNIGDLQIGHAGLVQQVDTNAPVTIAAQNGGNAVNVAGTAGNRQLKGVAAGSADDDAVNVGQLNALSDQVGDVGARGVKYDDLTKTSVTLGGVESTAPVALRNIADGALSASSHDAVNGSQLFATNQNVAVNTRNITNLDGRVTINESNISDLQTGRAGLVLQSDASAPVTIAAQSGGNAINFAGMGGSRQLKGVAAGTADDDAVNLGQLNNLSDQLGSVSALAVKYDNGNKTSVTLGGVDATLPVALRNIADGALSASSHDAVNGSQLYATNQQVVGNTSNINDLLIGRAGLVQQTDASAAVTMAAGSGGTLVTVNGTGGDRQIRGVAAATQDNDAVNLGQLKDLAGDVGQIDALAVKYDGVGRSAITLGGLGAMAPVAIHNVANGVSTYDAVNFGQLSDLRNHLQFQINGLDTRVTVLENEDRKPPYLDGTGSGGADDKANAGDSPGVALGYNSVATGDNASAVGHNAQALGAHGLAVGNDSYAAGDNDTAIGGNARVGADNSVAVGANSTVAAGASNAAAVGANSSVSAASGTAVGQGASVTSSATNAVALGAGSVADRANTVSVGAEGAERQITNVAAGTQATDAVNVGQLQNLQDWTTRKVDDLQQLINRNQRQANRGIASSAALVNNMPYVPGKVALSAGAASYRGESALGVAVSRWSKDGRVNFNAGVSAARGDSPIFRVGVGVVLGD